MINRKSSRFGNRKFFSMKQQYQAIIMSGRQFKDQAIRQQSTSKESPLQKKNSNVQQKISFNHEVDIFCTKIIANKKFHTKLQSNTQQINGQQQSIQQIEEIRKSRQSKNKDLVFKNKQKQQQKNQQKVGVLKRLLENHNTKSQKKKHYQKLINTFGLRIQSVKYQSTDKKKQKMNKVGNTFTRKIQLPQNEHYKSQLSSKLQQSKFENKKKIIEQLRYKIQQDKKMTLKEDHRPQTSSVMQRRKQQNLVKYLGEKDSFQSKLKKYKQFLFLINISNYVYRDLDVEEYQTPLKYFVGSGNNGNLIVSVMQKRFWFVKTYNFKEANFVWTQLKIEQIFEKQQKNLHLLDFINQEQQKKSTKQIQEFKSPRKRNGPRLHEPKNPHLKILNHHDYQIYCSNPKLDVKSSKTRVDFFHKINLMKRNIKIDKQAHYQIVHNHIPSNGLLGNKKAMYYCLREYYRLVNKDLFSVVPLTFHVQQGLKDQQFKKFQNYYIQNKKNHKPNIWIIKPGQYTNRGNGISCSNKLQQIKKKISLNMKQMQTKRTFILQSYITKPLLYNRRKFDIRAYMLITVNNGIVKGYWYQQGYVRTSSYYFDINDLSDPMIHLTNDAVQKNGQQYGSFQQGNKLSYNQLERYLQSINNKFNFYDIIYPEMRRIATEAIFSTALFLDPTKRENNFEIFGLDFMIDENFKVWLIEINTNPCLELSCGILQRIIPHMVQNAFRIGLDPIFPPQNNFAHSKKYNVSENALFYNKFELVYDQIRDGLQLRKLYKNTKLLQQIGVVSEDKQQYQNEGEIIEIND